MSRSSRLLDNARIDLALLRGGEASASCARAPLNGRFARALVVQTFQSNRRAQVSAAWAARDAAEDDSGWRERRAAAAAKAAQREAEVAADAAAAAREADEHDASGDGERRVANGDRAIEARPTAKRGRGATGSVALDASGRGGGEESDSEARRARRREKKRLRKEKRKAHD